MDEKHYFLHRDHEQLCACTKQHDPSDPNPVHFCEIWREEAKREEGAH